MVKSISELWVGDILELTKSKRIGKFVGADKSGKLRIDVNGKIVLASLHQISLYQEPEEEIDLSEFDLQQNTEKGLNISKRNEIDLHIDVLAPYMEHQPSARILDFQVKTFLEFLDNSLKMKMGIITIIHGKGEGVLKTEIQHLLKHNSRVSMIQEVNGGGATTAWLNS